MDDGRRDGSRQAARDGDREWARGAVRLAAALGAFAVVHSLLASRGAKDAAARVAGERARDGWYRVAFNAQAVLGFGLLAAYARRLPDRPLYEHHGRTAALLRAAQAAGVAYMAWAAWQVGLGRMSGVTSLRAWAGDGPVAREPEAQGPARSPDGGMRATGPFRWSRHPLNLAPLPVLWLNPRMTANLAVFNVLATIYLALGSVHEERRLAAAYGDDYEAYRRSGVPFYLPGPGRPLDRGRGHGAVEDQPPMPEVPAPSSDGSARLA